MSCAREWGGTFLPWQRSEGGGAPSELDLDLGGHLFRAVKSSYSHDMRPVSSEKRRVRSTSASSRARVRSGSSATGRYAEIVGP